MPRIVSKKVMIYFFGSFILIAGITLLLLWWKDVAVLFRGGMPMALSLAGLLVLYSLNK